MTKASNKEKEYAPRPVARPVRYGGKIYIYVYTDFIFSFAIVQQ